MRSSSSNRPSDREGQTPRSEFPAIYASPTVETLDGSLVSGRREYIRAVQEKPPQSPRGANARSILAGVSRTAASPTRRAALQYTPQKTPTHAIMPTTPSSRNISHRSVARETSRRKRRKPRDFQVDQDALHVSVRTVNVAARTVFEPIPPVSLQEWQKVAKNAEQQRKVSMRKRLSPSLQHLQLLHRFQQVTTLRQLNFSPSSGLNATVLQPLQQEDQSSSGVRKPYYQSIDPIQATRTVLPDTPPLLSNRKYRLPLRSDVGFPNATAEELQLKQNEIRFETQWEEASPRLMVLITSDSLGQTVANDSIPLAGKELMMAKQANERFRKNPRAPNKDQIEGNRHSVLAPPLGAIYNSFCLSWSL